MNTFFTYIRRINSLLLFGGLVAVTLLLIWGIGSGLERNNRDVVTTVNQAGSAEKLHFHLDEIRDVPGTNTQMLKLTASKTKSGLAYSGYERDTRNILFLSGDDKAARWLFPDQNHVIHTAAQLQAQDEDKKTADADKVTAALYYLYSDKDTNSDGEITKDDKASLGLSKADGEGFTAVLAGIDWMYSVSLTGNHSISILYRIGKSLRHARYSVETLTREFDREVTAIPGIEYRD